MADLAELSERLAKASGPDRELDKALRYVFDKYNGTEPRYTSSIDAALALVEKVLPGWCWVVDGGGSGVDAGPSVANLFQDTSNATPEYRGRAPTPPLAILLALLNALSKGSPDV